MGSMGSYSLPERLLISDLSRCSLEMISTRPVQTQSLTIQSICTTNLSQLVVRISIVLVNTRKKAKKVSCLSLSYLIGWESEKVPRLFFMESSVLTSCDYVLIFLRIPLSCMTTSWRSFGCCFHQGDTYGRNWMYCSYCYAQLSVGDFFRCVMFMNPNILSDHSHQLVPWATVRQPQRGNEISSTFDPHSNPKVQECTSNCLHRTEIEIPFGYAILKAHPPSPAYKFKWVITVHQPTPSVLSSLGSYIRVQ